ncbi:hypothetical protein KY284_025631 [Solanum tuberosum]|nr:hypothetical protein KY284_025631 [Solanum tuberosum]
MTFDAASPNFPQGSSWQSFSNIEPESSHPCEPSMEEDPNPESQKLYDLLQAAVLNFDDKTKDNPQSRQDMVKYCDRPQLAKDSNGKYPKVVYTIDKEARAILFNWVKGLKFPDGYLGTLTRIIGNKASVEGSICEAYLMTESTQLFSHYFEPHVMTCRLWGEAKRRDLSLEEFKDAQTYILLNCEEVEPFVSMFMQHLQEEFPNLSQGQIDESLEANFSIWFKEFVQCNPIENEFLRSLAHGPLIDATCYSAHNQYKLVDINHRRRYKKYEPFILAMQATQVCYVPYPSKKKDKDDWAAVLKVKPQNVIELPNEEVATVSEVNVPFQVEEVEVHEIDMTVSIDENILLNDPNGDVIEMDEPIDDGLLQENHEIHIESTEEEYETEETEETEENEDEEEEAFEEDND